MGYTNISVITYFFLLLYIGTTLAAVFKEITLPADYYAQTLVSGCSPKFNLLVESVSNEVIQLKDAASLNSLTSEIIYFNGTHKYMSFQYLTISLSTTQPINLLINSVETGIIYNYTCQGPPSITFSSVVYSDPEPNGLYITAPLTKLMVFSTSNIGGFFTFSVENAQPGVFHLIPGQTFKPIASNDTTSSFTLNNGWQTYTIIIPTFLSTTGGSFTSFYNPINILPFQSLITSYVGDNWKTFDYIHYLHSNGQLQYAQTYNPVQGTLNQTLFITQIRQIDPILYYSNVKLEMNYVEYLKPTPYAVNISNYGYVFSPSTLTPSIYIFEYVSGFRSMVSTLTGKSYLPYIPLNLADVYKIPYPTFPYGYKSGDVNNAVYSATPMLSKYTRSGSQTKFLDFSGVNIPSTYTNNEPDTVLPTLIKLEFIEYKFPSWILKITVSDDLSGVSFIKVGDIDLSTKDLVQGSIFNGVYETIIYPNQVSNGYNYLFNLYDNAFNCYYYQYSYDKTKYNIIFPPPMTPRLPSPAALTHINFNLTSSIVTLNFTVDNPQLYRPLITFNILNYYNQSYNNMQNAYFRWNSNTKLFENKFYLPNGLYYSNVDYQLEIYPFTFSPGILSSLLGPSAWLKPAQLVDADQFPPIVDSVSFSKTSIVVGQDVSIDITISINEHLHGLGYGNVTFTSDKDPVGHTFYFDNSTRITDNNYKFTIYFNNSNPQYCRPQTFKIGSIYLIDGEGYLSSYPSRDYFNPIYTVQINNDPIGFTTTCTATAVDTNGPTLTSFKVTPTVSSTLSYGYIDVGKAEPYRQFTVEFSITENESGILSKNLPVLYIEGLNSVIGFTAQLNGVGTLNQQNYKVTATLPYAFGYYSLKADYNPNITITPVDGTTNGSAGPVPTSPTIEYPDGLINSPISLRDYNNTGIITLSLYGIFDNYLNIKGYSVVDLRNAGFIGTLNTTCTYQPIIESTSPITEDGGVLILYGKRFKASARIYVQISYDNANFENANIIFNSGTIIEVSGVRATRIPYVVKLSIDLVVSDPFIVYPVLKPTVQPVITNPPVKCASDCGGSDHGDCTPNGCVCKSSWIGVDCLSAVVFIDKPAVNVTSPTTQAELPSGDTVTYSSLVSVHSIREITPNGTVVFNQTFSQWILTDISSNGSTKYLYFANLTKDLLVTNITVTLEWFNSTKIIEFAGQNLTMNPSTMKYNINITKYSFELGTNTLQVIFAASLQSSATEDTCSKKDFGDVPLSDLEYVKLKVNQNSLYGRFIKRGIIDQRVRSISNTLLDESGKPTESYQSQSMIAINVPHFFDNAMLDPDFSILVDSGDTDDTDANCGGQVKPLLSRNQIIGIAIGGAAFLLLSGFLGNSLTVTDFVIPKDYYGTTTGGCNPLFYFLVDVGSNVTFNVDLNGVTLTITTLDSNSTHRYCSLASISPIAASNSWNISLVINSVMTPSLYYYQCLFRFEEGVNANIIYLIETTLQKLLPFNIIYSQGFFSFTGQNSEIGVFTFVASPKLTENQPFNVFFIEYNENIQIQIQIDSSSILTSGGTRGDYTYYTPSKFTSLITNFVGVDYNGFGYAKYDFSYGVYYPVQGNGSTLLYISQVQMNQNILFATTTVTYTNILYPVSTPQGLGIPILALYFQPISPTPTTNIINLYTQSQIKGAVVSVPQKNYISGVKAQLLSGSSLEYITPYPTFPYGMISGTTNQYTMATVFLHPLYVQLTGMQTRQFTYAETTLVYTYFVSGFELDIDKPILKKIQFIPFKFSTWIIKVRAVDEISGISKIQIGPIEFTAKDLTYGSIYDGIFEKEIYPHQLAFGYQYQVKIFDNAYNLYSFEYTYDTYKYNVIFPQPMVPKLVSPKKMIQFTLSSGTLITMGSDNYNTVLEFNISDANPALYRPMLKINLLNLYNRSQENTYFTWNNAKKLFEFPLNLPGRLASQVLDYKLVVYPFTFGVQSLASLFSKDVAFIKINQTTETDQFPPIIDGVSYSPSSSVIITAGTTTRLEISVTIAEYMNGLAGGNITFGSDYDPIGFTFNFTDEFKDPINSNVYTFVVKFGPESYCIEAMYTITSVFLIDGKGFASVYPSMQYYNPLYNLLVDGVNFSFQVGCGTLPTDNVEPKLNSFSVVPYSNPLDICKGPSQRTVYIDFETSDQLSGILSKNLPTVYFEGLNDIIGFQPSIIDLTTNGSNYRYRFTVTLPYAFGLYSKITSTVPSSTTLNPIAITGVIPYPTTDSTQPVGPDLKQSVDAVIYLDQRGSIALSVYGIFDKAFNVKGYTFTDLQSFSSSYINITCNYGPIIESTSPITEDGGRLVLNGRRFRGTTVRVQVSYDLVNFENANVLYLSGMMVEIGSIKPTRIAFMVIITVDGVSEKITIWPILKPTVLPVISNPPVKCISDCGGSDHGDCTPNGCVCKSSWIGIDCLSTVVIIEKPKVNETSPTIQTELPSGDTVTYSSLVSVHSIREITPNGTVVFNQTFSQWILTDISSNSSTKYLYFVNFTKDSITTNITVTLEWFNSTKIIEFAGQNLTMNPSTMKYNVNITKYSFELGTNTLQIIFAASLQSSATEDTCSKKDFGDVPLSDLEYVKLKVNQNSLYGRFIKRGIIDQRVRSISNTLLDESGKPTESYQSQSMIAINVPHFFNNAMLDPDFSILVDSGDSDDTDDDNVNCGNNNDKPLLSRNQIIGIAIGGAAFLLLTGLLGYYLLFVKYRYSALGIKLLKTRS
ncbi:EGF-like domain-containing protein [Tieghemostelium lacteum]|uniref:EGF-like domain-containing protein n=1 Tax=Tieghemostelium lacteum TaxID=361077 RepID=A0A151Z949_TIELA|nr:EGF-like domain-containing protein [Tieghemostelium lacteum]|eukprot:KYQ90456.1 EGF-like domain-containing protein [Tieghemostelium lacteum]